MMRSLDLPLPREPLSAHLEALRWLVVWLIGILAGGMGGAFYFREEIISHLTRSVQGISFVLLSPLEGFLLSCQVAFWVGLLGSSPLWLMVLIPFLAPAFFPEERRRLLPLGGGVTLALALAILVADGVSLPLANTYLGQFNQGLGINAWSLARYLDFVWLIFFGHAVLAEFFVILGAMVFWGWITAEQMRRRRRLFIVLAFLVSAILTPPDVVSQCMMAIPAVAFYEMLLILLRFTASDGYR